MRIEFIEINLDQLAELITPLSSPEDFDKIIQAAINARPLTAVWYGDELLCIYALIPLTLLSDRAYIWMYWTETVGRHKLVFARRAKRLTQELLDKYSTLIGHCLEPGSRPWLMSVGATFRGDEFMISR